MSHTLRGLTWDHTRGYAPLAATAQTFADFHPGVRIAWEVRSLGAFGEGGLADVARDYDLVCIDHPFIGAVAEHGWFLPLDEHLSAAKLATLRAQSAGASYASYEWDGHLWALPIDAACHVAAAREDLLHRHGVPYPETWDDVLRLARETGKVAQPFNRMGYTTAFFSLCASAGEAPMPAGSDRVVSRETGALALDRLRQLFVASGPESLQHTAVQTLNRLATTDTLWFVPCVFGYTNYARDGFAPHRLRFAPIPGSGVGGTLGGVGLAIPTRSQHRAAALEYAAWVAGAECQRTLFLLAGGQPANVEAWRDPLANQITGGFLRDTLTALERAYVRPRHAGYHVYQTRAADVILEFLEARADAATTLEALDRLYARSLTTPATH